MAGFKNCLVELEMDAFAVETIATDHNKQVAKCFQNILIVSTSIILRQGHVGKSGSKKTYYNLEKVVMDKKSLADMVHLSKPFHTRNVEVLNSLVNMYAPKRQEFDFHVMDGRVKLAVSLIENKIRLNERKREVQR